MRIKFLLIFFTFLTLIGCAGVSSTGVFGTGVSVAIDPRSLGTQIDDSIMQKNLSARIILLDKNYFLSVKSKTVIFIASPVLESWLHINSGKSSLPKYLFEAILIMI